MLHLVLIGDRSADIISGVLSKNFDYLDISQFKSISDFYSTANVRSMNVDRLILLQDSLNEGVNVATLEAFNDYLGRNYPAVRVITLLNNKTTVELLRGVFISPYMVHILVDKMKPRMLNDLIELPINQIGNKYGYKGDSEDELTGVVGEIIDEIPEEQQENKPEEQQKGKKKKGLFSFLKRDKKPKEEKRNFTPIEAVETETPIQNEEEDQNEEIEQDNQDEETVENIEHEENEGDLEFTMFEDDSNLGIGVTVSKEVENEEPDFSEFEETYVEVEEEEDSEIDYSIFNEPPQVDTEETDTQENEIYTEPEKEPYVVGLDIHQDEDTAEEEEVEVSTTDSQEKLNKLEELKKSVFEKDLKDIKTPKVTAIQNQNINVSEVEHENLLFGDLDGMSKEYDNKNVKVVERVVETVVEKVVNVGTKQRSYKNGIRTIVVTGDRKTGVTKTAMNIASYFSKTSKTLYVDFDTERHGSLLYIGLESISNEEEHIRNGIKYLKNVNTIPNIAYNFKRGGFDCLVSSYGEEINDERIKEVQRVLSIQREYKTLIIDCPLENLSYLDDIMVYSEIIVCIESDLQCTLNTLLGISGVTEDDRYQSYLFNNSQFLVNRGSTQEFSKNISYVRDMFQLDEMGINWGNIPILGTVKDLGVLLKQY